MDEKRVVDEERYPVETQPGISAPTTVGDNSALDGREAALWKGGHYGDALRGRNDLDRDRVLAKPYKFRPGAFSALRSATRRALGR